MSLTCYLCGKPLVKSRTDAYAEETRIEGGSAIERAWHRSCEPFYVPPDTPWQAAVQKLKQAVADAKRLGPEGELAFWAVFEQIRGQRD